MAIIPLFRDLLREGWSACCRRHEPYFAGLWETYGPELLGPGFPGALVAAGGAAVASQLLRVAPLGWEEAAAALLSLTFRHLPGPAPDLYLGTLFGMAPAATIGVQGRPAIALGLERFDPLASREPPPRTFFAPEELADMVPHEAAHAIRMQALTLPPSPRVLPLAEMLLLEGTALLFTDALLGRETLPGFMPAADLARHQAMAPHLARLVAPDLDRAGPDVFARYFSPAAPVSGYYVGLELCRRYCQATGIHPADLVTVPTRTVLGALGLA